MLQKFGDEWLVVREREVVRKKCSYTGNVT